MNIHSPPNTATGAHEYDPISPLDGTSSQVLKRVGYISCSNKEEKERERERER
jgi:hypothetical protein